MEILRDAEKDARLPQYKEEGLKPLQLDLLGKGDSREVEDLKHSTSPHILVTPKWSYWLTSRAI